MRMLVPWEGSSLRKIRLTSFRSKYRPASTNESNVNSAYLLECS